MIEEYLLLPYDIETAVGRVAIFSLFPLGLTVLAFYANMSKKSMIVIGALILAILTSVWCIVYENTMIEYIPEQYWSALPVLWKSGRLYFWACITLIYAHYALPVIAAIGLTVKLLSVRHRA